MEIWIKVKWSIYIGLVISIISCKSESTPTPIPDDTPPENNSVWVDPIITNDNNQGLKVIVWFDDQLIQFNETYLEKTANLTSGRSQLRNQFVTELKGKNEMSMNSATVDLSALENEGLIESIEPMWIVNGFTCIVNQGGIDGLMHVEGVHSIFRAQFSTATLTEHGPRTVATQSGDFIPSGNSTTTWNIAALEAPRVWNELGITGKGVKVIIHEAGLRLTVPAITESIYANPLEIPDNQVDDDGNGYIDDVHGYNFEFDNPLINVGFLTSSGIIHGSSVTGIICGREVNGTLIGVAPNAKWAAVLALSNFAEAVQWAIEMDFDLYNMSFSLGNVQEVRSHWRLVVEHAALCGIFMVSGAGNFGDPSRSGFLNIPGQIRTPENIPEALFTVAGVGEELDYPAFSSKGPVLWDTHHYDEGEVNKPDFATFNLDVPTISESGSLSRNISGNSLASPHLSGDIALMLEANPELNVWQVRQILINTVTDIEEDGFDVKTGFGLINAYEAVKAVN